MDTALTLLLDFQPAGVIIVLVAVAAVVGNHFAPQIGPWVALAALAGVMAYAGNRVVNVADRPAWLLPLALAGAVAGVLAAARLVRAIKARSQNDMTVGYVFPTALAIVAMWLSIALINFESTHQVVTGS